MWVTPMASNIVFRHNRAGFIELRNSPAMQAECLAKAEAIASRATSASHGGEWVADVREGRDRCVAMVKPADGPKGNIAVADNYRRNTLLKSRGW